MAQIDIESLPVEHPAQEAWEKYKVCGNAYGDEVRLVFMNGWNAAFAWLSELMAESLESKDPIQFIRSNVDSKSNPA